MNRQESVHMASPSPLLSSFSLPHMPSPLGYSPTNAGLAVAARGRHQSLLPASSSPLTLALQRNGECVREKGRGAEGKERVWEKCPIA